MTATFGPDWSRALMFGCSTLDVPPEWPLAVFALESSFSPFARNASGAFGLYQQMPRNGVPYTETDPVKQIVDAFRFWTAMKEEFHVPSFTSRAAFYCLNLAPARLANGMYDDETVLYAYSHHPNEYLANRDLDWNNRGDIRIGDLDHSLDQAVARCSARYYAELASAREATDSSPTDVGG